MELKKKLVNFSARKSTKISLEITSAELTVIRFPIQMLQDISSNTGIMPAISSGCTIVIWTGKFTEQCYAKFLHEFRNQHLVSCIQPYKTILVAFEFQQDVSAQNFGLHVQRRVITCTRSIAIGRNCYHSSATQLDKRSWLFLRNEVKMASIRTAVHSIAKVCLPFLL